MPHSIHAPNNPPIFISLDFSTFPNLTTVSHSVYCPSEFIDYGQSTATWESPATWNNHSDWRVFLGISELSSQPGIRVCISWMADDGDVRQSRREDTSWTSLFLQEIRLSVGDNICIWNGPEFNFKFLISLSQFIMLLLRIALHNFIIAAAAVKPCNGCICVQKARKNFSETTKIARRNYLRFTSKLANILMYIKQFTLKETLLNLSIRLSTILVRYPL